jgi:hypothetical protein
MPEYPAEMVIVYRWYAELLRGENKLPEAEAAYRRAAELAVVAKRLGASTDTNN